MKLRQWYSVFATNDSQPSPAALLECLCPSIAGLIAEFEPDTESWRKGQFRVLPNELPCIGLFIRSHQTDDDFPRNLEKLIQFLRSVSDEPFREEVAEHVGRTRQIFDVLPLSGLGGSQMARLCEQLCGCLVRHGDGLIQVYQEGFFSPEGNSLLPHCPRHRLRTI